MIHTLSHTLSTKSTCIYHVIHDIIYIYICLDDIVYLVVDLCVCVQCMCIYIYVKNDSFRDLTR